MFLHPFLCMPHCLCRLPLQVEKEEAYEEAPYEEAPEAFEETPESGPGQGPPVMLALHLARNGYAGNSVG